MTDLLLRLALRGREDCRSAEARARVGSLSGAVGIGANALLFADLIPIYQKYGIEWGETQVEMEDNAAVQGQWGVLDPVLHKRRNCYIKSIR